MIYDCFIFFNEVELLELRLKTLNNYVDKFVLVELGTTHTNKPKPYYFDEFKHDFTEYAHKIIHIKKDRVPFTEPWPIENAHRNLITEGIKDAKWNDYVMISDLDEIPNMATVFSGINQGYKKFSLVQDLFCYYVNCKSGQEWVGTVVSQKGNIITPQDIRNNRHANLLLRSGGWHYSSMGGKDRIRVKFESFAETDFNIPKYMNDDNLDRCLETGKDLTDRTEEYAQKRFVHDTEIDHMEIFDWAIKYPNFKK